MAADMVWVGYEDIGFTPASPTRSAKFNELLTDASGLPIIHDMRRLYVKPGKSDALREAVHHATTFAGPLVVRLEKPMTIRYSWHLNAVWQQVFEEDGVRSFTV